MPAMPIEPNFKDFSDKYKSGIGQIVYTRQPADLLTPISAYLRLTETGNLACLFESVEGGRHRGRYSAIATHPTFIIKAKNDTVYIAKNVDKKGGGHYTQQQTGAFETLQKTIKETQFPYPEELPPICSGLFGYMSYETIHIIEKLPPLKTDNIQVPDMYFFVAGLTVVFDTLYDDIIISCPVYADNAINAKDAYQKALSTIQHVQSWLEKNEHQSTHTLKPLKTPVKNL